ncbi:hypothetical protein [Francisella philomiragia]|uniref:hypothetical protein n=1 Tax=Francisella philomiragia TaxID=28110 RepID=UPI002243DC44|nr:hypothetical protein [Francisella philomiragia]
MQSGELVLTLDGEKVAEHNSVEVLLFERLREYMYENALSPAGSIQEEVPSDLSKWYRAR